MQEHHVLNTIQTSLAQAITIHSGSPVYFADFEFGAASYAKDHLAKSLIRFESKSFAVEVSVSLSPEYFEWIFCRMFDREPKDKVRESGQLFSELLNIALGVANAHFDLQGTAGRFSFPRAFVGAKIQELAKSYPPEVVTVSFQCDGNLRRNGVFELIPADSLGIPWTFDSASIPRTGS